MTERKAIGPSFFAELKAHGGLIGEHFTWSEDGELLFFEDTPAEVRAGVEAVYTAHDPAVAATEPLLSWPGDIRPGEPSRPTR